ncbi:MAG: alkaline phosphatase D family protein [Egibacteraceae bacterium]
MSLSRRTFLRSTGAIAAALATSGLPAAAAAQGASPLFALGVASGDPLPDGVVLWTRLAPDPLAEDGGMRPRPMPVDWEVAEDETFGRVVQRGTFEATPDLAHSVHVDVRGLRPASWYWYRFRSASEISPVGRTRTAPEAGANPERLRFAFASCSQYEHGYFTAYRRLAEEDLDLAVHLGDYIYEYAAQEYVAPDGNVRDHVGPEMVTLANYRQRHAQYKTDPDLQAAHAALPWIVTWDDHETENNYADEIPEDGQSREAFRARRAAAYQAYWEHLPLREPPRGIDLPLYRRLTFGRLAEFNVLDTRQYRTDQPCGDEFPGQCAERSDPSATITGAEQERWLLDGLDRSAARWNVLAQQVFLAQIDLVEGAGQGFYVDGWDGYVASRDRLMDFIARRQPIDPINLVVLTGDWHANWLADLKADFDDPASATLGTELVGTSITSGGDGVDRDREGETVLAENPHIRFHNNQRGYVRCELTPDRWRADYRVLEYVRREGSPVATRASFVIENGIAGAQQA